MTFVSSTIFQPSYTRARRSPTLDQVRPAVCGRVDESPLVGRLRDVPDEVRDELAARAAIALYADPLRLSNAAERLRTAKQPRTRTRATMTGKSWSVPFESLREPRLHGVPASVERRPGAISGGPSPFRLPFESDSARRSQLPEKGKSRWNAGFRMARPGLEPGTPRFSVVAQTVSNTGERPGIQRFPVVASRRARSAQIAFFLADLGTRLQLGAQSAHAEHRFVRVSLERSVVTACGA
jgi:hypothetical protein